MKKKTWKFIFDLLVTIVNVACVIICGSSAAPLISM